MVVQAGPVKLRSQIHGGPSAADRALDVRLREVDGLVPEHLADDPVAIREWLRAPIAGVPVYQRLLEPLAGLPIAHLQITGGLVAETFVTMLRERATFGIVPDADVLPRAVEEGERATTVDLPGWALLDVDLRGLLEGFDAEDVAAFVLEAPEGHVHEIIRIGPRGVAPRILSEAVPIGQILPVDSAFALWTASRMVLEGDCDFLKPFGSLRGDLLCGGRATIGRDVKVSGVAAVGDESHVSRSVHLGHGAIVGRSCFVGDGAALRDCIVLDDCLVAPGESLRQVLRTARGDVSFFGG